MNKGFALGVVTATIVACTTFGAEPSESSPPLPPPSDGGVDASDDRRFCERVTTDGGETYCRDFDDGQPAESGWDSTTISPGATFALDPEAKTRPNSVRARIEVGGEVCSYARGKRNFAQATHVELAFDVRMGGADTSPDDEATFLVVGFGGGANVSCGLIFYASSQGGRVQEQLPGDVNLVHDLAVYPHPGTWSHVDVEIDRTTRLLDVRVDGKSAFGSPQTLQAECVALDHPYLNVGLHCETLKAFPREVRLDDIVMTTR